MRLAELRTLGQIIAVAERCLALQRQRWSQRRAMAAEFPSQPVPVATKPAQVAGGEC